MEAGFNFTDKLVLVSGATKGIGKACALMFASLGAKVVGSATSTVGAEAVTAMLADFAGDSRGIILNLADADNIKSALDEVKQHYQAMPDILVNNAGITKDNIFLRMKPAEWEEVIRVNLSGAFYLTQLCVKHMLKARFGRIINISSVVGFTGNPGQVNYTAAKAGLIAMTKSLAQELASRNITVNAVAPGFIQTNMTAVLPENVQQKILEKIPLSRMGTADEIAQAVIFLSSSMANYITGQTLHVNGGMY